MIPLRDLNPVRGTAVVNLLLVTTNVVVFGWFALLSPLYEVAYGLVPARFLRDVPGEAVTVLTSMFMHANLTHLAGNLLFLWIFGDNVEDSLGSLRYLGFYLMGGAAAAIAQIAAGHASTVPMVGASGAIAAVTAAYLVLFPRAPIVILNPVPPLWLIFGITFVVPAWLVAGEFIVMNVYLGLAAMGDTDGASGGVAVFAHLGGFAAGLLAIRPLLRGRRVRAHRAWDGFRRPGERGKTKR